MQTILDLKKRVYRFRMVGYRGENQLLRLGRRKNRVHNLD